MRKAIYCRVAVLIDQYPIDDFINHMGYDWSTMSEAEQRRWGYALKSIVCSLKISGRDESIK